MSRPKSSSRRPPPEIGLFMECEEEELNPAQKDFYGKIKKQHQTFNKKMEDYMKKMKGEVIIEEGDCFLFQFKQHQVCEALLLDVENQPVKPPQNAARGTRHTIAPPAPTLKTPATRGRRPGRPSASITHQATPPAVRTPRGGGTISLPLQPIVVTPITPPPVTIIPRKNVKALPPQDKPSEATALGGLSVGSKAKFYIPGEGEVDSREVVIGKTPGKTYPSLTIVTRPQLKLKPAMVLQGQTERANLDVQVKGVLMYTAAKFTEWLIQQGLICSVQSCKVHMTPDGKPVPLKLGMYNDVTKFPFSGGYVWVSDCCPSSFVSVFNGSIFEASPRVPNVILKLIYHWACQTNVPNVIQWVKVDSLYVKNIYTLLRGVCVLAVHRKFGLIGGRGKKVQVGLISLGIASQDGSSRHVKFEVLGVLDPETMDIRLQAADPGLKQEKRRMSRVFQALSTWVDKESTILTDTTVDLSIFVNMGFTRVEQSDGNKDVLEYLRRVVPRLFQNTLSLVSRSIIQQFLDELAWRERWGPIAAHAFHNITAHLAELTRAESDESVLKRLAAAATDPFHLYELPVTPSEPIQVTEENGKRGRKRPAEPEPTVTTTPLAKKPARTTTVTEPKDQEGPSSSLVSGNYWKTQPVDANISPEVANFLGNTGKVYIETYYYGTLRGDDSKIIDRKPAEVISIKCCICLKPFLDSLALMKHLLLHCQIKPLIRGPLRKIHQCNKCFLGFSTAGILRSHLNDVHSPPENLKHVICIICEKLFSDRCQFLYHMHRTHVAMELPYVCQVCGFRTSTYTTLTEHLSQAHRGGPHIFCPYCLKAVGLFRNNVPLPSNVVFFVNHVQRHQRQADARCHRCLLSFVSTMLLQRHLEKDHSSLEYNKDVRPFALNHGGKMPEPGNLIKPALLPLLTKPTHKPGMYSIREFPVPVKLTVDEGYFCAECEGSLTIPNHYVGELRCSCCKFMSCCELAVAEHYTIYHDVNAPVAFSPGKPVIQEFTMYCPCGFFSSSANVLARHLVACEKPTAYDSEATARSALEAMKKGKKPCDAEEPTMLNMLGLMRKSPEPDRAVEAGEVSGETGEHYSVKTPETKTSKQEVVDLEPLEVAEALSLSHDNGSSTTDQPGPSQQGLSTVGELSKAPSTQRDETYVTLGKDVDPDGKKKETSAPDFSEDSSQVVQKTSETCSSPANQDITGETVPCVDDELKKVASTQDTTGETYTCESDELKKAKTVPHEAEPCVGDELKKSPSTLDTPVVTDSCVGDELKKAPSTYEGTEPCAGEELKKAHSNLDTESCLADGLKKALGTEGDPASSDGSTHNLLESSMPDPTEEQSKNIETEQSQNFTEDEFNGPQSTDGEHLGVKKAENSCSHLEAAASPVSRQSNKEEDATDFSERTTEETPAICDITIRSKTDANIEITADKSSEVEKMSEKSPEGLKSSEELNAPQFHAFEPMEEDEAVEEAKTMDVDEEYFETPSKKIKGLETGAGEVVAEYRKSEDSTLKEIDEFILHPEKDAEATNRSGAHEIENQKNNEESEKQGAGEATEKEATGRLIAELEDIMSITEPANDAADFITDLMDSPSSQESINNKYVAEGSM